MTITLTCTATLEVIDLSVEVMGSMTPKYSYIFIRVAYGKNLDFYPLMISKIRL